MKNKPNILFIMTDQHRRDAMGCAGHSTLKTPNLDRLAAEGTWMDRAYCTTPLCVPSRTTIFTGRRASTHGTYGNKVVLGAGHFPITETLRKEGYQLALCGKNHAFTESYVQTWEFVELYDLRGKEMHAFCSLPGEDEMAVRKWRESCVPAFEAPVHQPQPGPMEADPTHRVTNHALRFLEQRDRTQPFFLHLSYESPHFPYVVPEPYYSMYNPAAMPGPGTGAPDFPGQPRRLRAQYYGLGLDRMNADDVRRVQATYLAMIRFVDDEIGRVYAALEKQGILDDTIIVFLSDHGDFWGHRGLIGKTNALYEDLLRVPLIWRIPGVTGGHPSSALVDHTDLVPTLCELIGLEASRPVDGRSYSKLLEGGNGVHRREICAENSLGAAATPASGIEHQIRNREIALKERGEGWFMDCLGGMTKSLLSEDGWKLIMNEGDLTELYDLNSDPGESRNVSGQFPEKTAALVARLNRDTALNHEKAR